MYKNYEITKQLIKANTSKRISSLSHYTIIINNSSLLGVDIHDKQYLFTGNDVLLLKPAQKAVILNNEDEQSELLLLYISKEKLLELSDKQLNFLEKFEFVPYDIALVHSQTSAIILLRNMLNRISNLKDEKLQFGLSLYEKSLLTGFLINFLRACILSDQVHHQNQKKELTIDEVYLFIKNHLTEDLSIKRLENVFYVSGEHICRKFKQQLGISLHQFILKSRIDLSKRYILEGKRINEIYSICGFNSYNHFFKAFKANENMTPLEYKNSFKNELSKSR